MSIIYLKELSINTRSCSAREMKASFRLVHDVVPCVSGLPVNSWEIPESPSVISFSAYISEWVCATTRRFENQACAVSQWHWCLSGGIKQRPPDGCLFLPGEIDRVASLAGGSSGRATVSAGSFSKQSECLAAAGWEDHPVLVLLSFPVGYWNVFDSVH